MATSSVGVELFGNGCLPNNDTIDQIRLLARVVECVCSNQPIMFSTINKHFHPIFSHDGVDARKVYIRPFKCSIKCTAQLPLLRGQDRELSPKSPSPAYTEDLPPRAFPAT